MTPAAPPPPPLTVALSWGGADKFTVSGASGSSADMGVYSVPLGGYIYPYYFAAVTSGGIAPINGNGLDVTYNPSGKLGVTWLGYGGAYWLTWSGLSLNEIEAITVEHHGSDSTGANVSASYTVVVRRTN
jgi:hypothetical protein